MKDSFMVCEHCLWAIESHEGKQVTITHYIDEEEENEFHCVWCEESGFDKLYEIL